MPFPSNYVLKGVVIVGIFKMLSSTHKLSIHPKLHAQELNSVVNHIIQVLLNR